MDRQLVERARHGDQDAFGTLAEASGSRLYAVAYRILRDVELAHDAVQQAFLDAWHDLPRLRDVDHFDAWLYRLLVNACSEHARRRSRWAATVRSLPAEPATADASRSVADRDQLERGFRGLTAEQRAVVVLHYYAGFPLTRIAAILGIPDGTVRSRLHYALEQLRAALDEDGRALQARERTA